MQGLHVNTNWDGIYKQHILQILAANSLLVVVCTRVIVYLLT